MEKSQYELEREANIARNRALLEELDLKQAVEGLGIQKPKAAVQTRAKPVQPKKKHSDKAKEAEVAPRRQSARLRNVAAVDPNESPEKKRKREAELEERRAKEAEERLLAEERERLAKRPRHEDLDLQTLAEAEDTIELGKLSEALKDLAQTAQPRKASDFEAYAYTEDAKNQAAVNELKEKLEKLKVVSRAKVTQHRIYTAAYHPEVTKDLIFFGDKNGVLGIWDARAPPKEVAGEDGDTSAIDTAEGGKYWQLQLHWPATPKSSITNIKFDPIDSHNVYTSSYDCTVRTLSFTSGVSREIFAMEEGFLIPSIDLTPTGHEMWISDSLGGAVHLDLREPKTAARRYELSGHKIGSVSVNPTRTHFLLTASNSRNLKIWDIRKLGKIPYAKNPPTPSSDRDSSGNPALIDLDFETVEKYCQSNKGLGSQRADWVHGKSVSSAYWDPRGRSIVSTSYDDALRLWEFNQSVLESNDTFPSSRPFSRIHHDCQTGKWLTILRAQWSPNPDVYPHFTVGNMKHSLDIFSCKGDLIVRLSDPTRISAVQAVTCSHPTIVERAASGNASGRCVLWAPADDN
ncbi:hypothetical protein AX16_004763 [Volvariella volvacea WC 439]|nr:hypothetical protein AX16_004763 [Volvariella volvacea WC 439]